MTVRYSTGHEAPLGLEPSTPSRSAAPASSPAAGVLAPNPVEAFLRWRRAHRTCTHLAEALGWVDQRRAGRRAAHADDPLAGLLRRNSHRPGDASRSPTPFTGYASTAATPPRSAAAATHQPRWGGRCADPSTWAATGDGGVIAAELLHTEPGFRTAANLDCRRRLRRSLMKRAYANRDAIAGLDPGNYLRTYQLTILYDFPKDARIGLNLAFYRVFATPRNREPPRRDRRNARPTRQARV